VGDRHDVRSHEGFQLLVCTRQMDATAYEGDGPPSGVQQCCGAVQSLVIRTDATGRDLMAGRIRPEVGIRVLNPGVADIFGDI
jgi:hypothetical protein